MIETISLWVFWAAALALLHVYGGYEMLLRLAVRLCRPTSGMQPAPEQERPTVSVLLTVHNEQDNVVPRLENLLQQDYPADRLEIVVASDASDDDTEALAAAFAQAHPGSVIRVLAVAARGGKSAAQNHALPELSGEVVVLTDAATRFAPDFLSHMTAPFADPAVGCVSGQVVFAQEGSAVSQGQQRYWRSEMTLRACESQLGILAVASGQAMAFRRRLFRPLPLHVGDDCIIPLDVAAAGARVVHQPAALAYDVNETRTARELRARARMTARNWVGTWRHPRLLSPVGHPGYCLALWSHKLMRWLSPVFLVLLALASLLLVPRPFYSLCALLGVLLLVLAGLGFAAERGHGPQRGAWRILPRFAFAFVVAQLGFLWGLWIAARGRRILAYSNKG
ncbi:MAG: glycosyltransferase [Bacteroidales bacterium]